MTNEARQSPKLGEVLVQHGVMSAEQLAFALDEQRRTGRPLGEIVVERGFAPGPIVAQALATQHGGMVKTEYGYATGFQATVRTAASPAVTATAPEQADPRDAQLAELRRLVAARDAEIERLGDMIGQLRAQCVDAAKVKVRAAELEAELQRLRGVTMAL
jgi:hypothetical protein